MPAGFHLFERPADVGSGVYITGTDTGIGKTWCTVGLIEGLRQRGLRVAGMKPVASGCEATPEGWRNADALALQRASGGLPYAWVNPFALPEATAPEIAAARAGMTVELAPILEAWSMLRRHHEFVVVEGVGGWLAPLARHLTQAQLARTLQLPVICVVGLRLGCLNHALLTERAVRDDGLQLLGWLGCAAEPAAAFDADYLDLLRAHLTAPCLGVIGHGESASALSFEPSVFGIGAGAGGSN